MTEKHQITLELAKGKVGALQALAAQHGLPRFKETPLSYTVTFVTDDGKSVRAFLAAVRKQRLGKLVYHDVEETRSAKDLAGGAWFVLQPGQIEANPRNTKIDRSRACPDCGAGGRLAGTLDMKHEKPIDKKRLVRTAFDGLIVVGESLAEEMRRQRFSGVEYRPILFGSGRKLLWLDITHTLPPASQHKGLSAAGKCPRCKLGGFLFTHVPLRLAYAPASLATAKDFNVSAERIFNRKNLPKDKTHPAWSGGEAMIVVSACVQQFLQGLSLAHLEFVPIAGSAGNRS